MADHVALTDEQLALAQAAEDLRSNQAAAPDFSPWANVQLSGVSKNQAHRLRADVKVYIGGQDITSKLNPYLISVTVTDKMKDTDTCSVEIDDRNAEITVPVKGTPIQVWMGWRGESMKLTFGGVISSIESGFGRKTGGRRMWIEGQGADLSSLAKTPMSMSLGEGQKDDSQEDKGGQSMLSFMEKAAGQAGFTMSVGPSLSGITRSFWQQNESFIHLGNRIAREVGGVFKLTGTQGTIVNPLNAETHSGETMPLVGAEWGVNLIGWRIKPFVARPLASKTNAAFFDPWNSNWQNVAQAVGMSGEFTAKGESAASQSAPNKQIGGQWDVGQSTAIDMNKGTGWVLINGEPDAKALGGIRIIGARPGVDGDYTITEAEHTYTRGGGYVTRCNVTPRTISSTSVKPFLNLDPNSGQNT